MRETQESITEWVLATFPDAPGAGLTPRHCIRLLEEVIELCHAAGATFAEIQESFIRTAFDSLARHGGTWVDPMPAPEKVPEEMADCEIVLASLAGRARIDLGDETDRKMVVNRGRTWAFRGDGTGYHTDPPGDGPGIIFYPPQEGR